MSKEVVLSAEAPAPVGPYSQAIKANGFIFVSGTLGLDHQTGKLLEGVGPQTQLALQNMSKVLEAAGSSMAKVVKTTILLTDIEVFKEVNAIYATFFPSQPPARATYAVKALPLGALVEIEAVALA